MSTIDASYLEQLGLTKDNTQTIKKKDELGQQEFMHLMVTQMQMQDPFKPMENGDFIAQMAQFSTLSSMGDLQTAFSTLSNTLQSNMTLQAAGLVDRDVLVESAYAGLSEGGSVKAAIDVPGNYESFTVSVYDITGQLVRKIPVEGQGPGLADFEWDGLKEDGTAAEAGMYEFRAEGLAGGEPEGLHTLISSRVESVWVGDEPGSFTLKVSHLGYVDFSEVRQIR